MSINLWRLGGKPTSYNPLPIGWNNNIIIGINNFVLSFRAKSQSGAMLNVSTTNNSTNTNFTLTADFKQYTLSVSNIVSQTFYIADYYNRGDIIIDSIELVRKPLPKLTVNGIDGFQSGKWTLHANAQVVDDTTLVLNATGGNQFSYVIIDCLPNTAYSLNIDGSLTSGNGSIDAQELDINSVFIKDNAKGFASNGNVSVSFTTSATTRKLKIILYSSTTGTFTFKKPMLNLGNVPAPYSKKTGDKMVLPTPKKNLFDGALEEGGINGGTGVKGVDALRFRTVNFTRISPNKSYIFSGDITPEYIYFFDAGFNFISVTTNPFTAPSNAYYILVRFLHSGNPVGVNGKLQLEQGTIATPYTPYDVQVNKKPQRVNGSGQSTTVSAKTGLSFNGITDYLQLPSMTMDSIEIECLIPGGQTNTVLVDARTGLTNGWVWSGTTNFGSDWNRLVVDGVEKSLSWSNIPNNIRTKIKIYATNQFVDNVTLFCNYAQLYYLKGTLYKVTCYLAGQVVAQYDFENPKNIVGNTVISNAQNLIPSFEDSRWSIHANAKVLGKDVLHLDATGTWQDSIINLSIPNGTYRFIYGSNGGYRIYGDVNETMFLAGAGISVTFTTTTGFVRIRLGSITLGAGSFDFYKPQLYQLTGKEGTINGAPIVQRKASKRKLYAKR